MWKFCNPNPCNLLIGDCVVRACTIGLDSSWHKTHDQLCSLSGYRCNMPSANVVWGEYLESKGMIYHEPFARMTVRQFCKQHQRGVFTIGTGTHAVTVIDGDWYDIWDSGDEYVSYYFERS